MEQAIKIGLLALSCAMVIISGVFCLAKVTCSGYKAMARQPEVADKIKSALLMPLGFIEGAALLGVIACGLLSFAK
ncbi:MAG: hypothetical protein AAF900_01390 [Bacteroidota bacterium]